MLTNKSASVVFFLCVFVLRLAIDATGVAVVNVMNIVEFYQY